MIIINLTKIYGLNMIGLEKVMIEMLIIEKLNLKEKMSDGEESIAALS